jgi:hypothetical protein
MFKQVMSNTRRLFSTSGTFGEIDLVGSGRGVALTWVRGQWAYLAGRGQPKSLI